MKAATFEAFGQPLVVRDVADPKPAAESVIVRVAANGICRSDWHGWMGHDPDVKVPHVPGHELAGVIEELGSGVRRWRAGERVTVPFACGCGNCRYCQRGQLHICDNYSQPGFTHWGAFAELVEIKHADLNLVRIPDELDFVTASTLGCRVATAFRAVVDQGQARAGDWVAIHGCGGIGLSAVMVAVAIGARVVAIDQQTDKLELASSLGAEITINVTRHRNIVDAIHETTGGGADISLDALGSRETCRNSLLCLRKQGRHVQVGLLVGEVADPDLPVSQLTGRELIMMGSHGMAAGEYPRLLEMVVRGQVQPQRLVRRRISLSEAPQELAAMTQYNTLGITVIDRFGD